MTEQETRIAGIRERLNDPNGLLYSSDVRFLLSQLEEARKPIAEQFLALGWEIDSIEAAAEEMERLSAGWRAEAVNSWAAKHAASSLSTEGRDNG